MFSNALCSKEEITAIKNSQDPELIAFAKETVEEAEKLLDQENSRLDAIQMKGFAYHYTGDARYLENARKIIDSKINKELWISNEYDPTRYNGYDIRTALETGDRCAEMAYLVSLFGEELTEDEIKELDYIKNVIFISAVFENCVCLRNLLPKNDVQYVTSEEVTKELIEKLFKNNLNLDISYKRLNKENIKLLHSNDIKVNCWTCNDKDIAEKLVSFGVDFITTNILE